MGCSLCEICRHNNEYSTDVSVHSAFKPHCLYFVDLYKPPLLLVTLMHINNKAKFANILITVHASVRADWALHNTSELWFNVYILLFPIHVVFYRSLRLAQRCPASTLVYINIACNVRVCTCIDDCTRCARDRSQVSVIAEREARQIIVQWPVCLWGRISVLSVVRSNVQECNLQRHTCVVTR